MSSIPAKDVIYIDVDDEITAIIDKVRGSQSKIIALVLPKRATTLQSIVNMKLLKKSADSDKKHLVLITSEAGLLPLAANVGFYVAKTLQTKPEIPDVPQNGAMLPDDLEEAVSLDDNLNTQATVGELARKNPSVLDADDEPIELDNRPKPLDPSARGHAVVGGGAAGATHAPKSVAPAAKKDKKLKIPNFGKFRTLLILGGAGVVAVIVLLYVCIAVLPSAKVLVKTDSEAVTANLNLTFSTTTQEVNTDSGAVPAQQQKTQKTLTQQVAATGQKNNGQKAGGSMTLTNCSGQDVVIPAGTGFSANGMTFLSTDTANVPDSSYKKNGDCNSNGTDTVGVVAQSAGASYNLAPTTYVIASNPKDVSAKGDAMSGGTDQITKIVQQSDIDDAKKKLEGQDSSAIKQQLKNQLSKLGLVPIAATFASSGSATASANAGDAADNVTVTENITYTMLGAKERDLQKVIADAVKDDIDTKKQKITDYGINGATYASPSTSDSSTSLTMGVTVVAGPEFDLEAIKKQIAGKKSGDVQNIIKSYPGVTGVDTSYSPFWVHSVPSKVNKITITIDKPQATVKSNGNQ